MEDNHGKSSFQQEEDPFHQYIVIKFKEEATKMLHLERSFLWCRNLDTLESRAEMPGRFEKCVTRERWGRSFDQIV
jgi:hypothetical protein